MIDLVALAEAATTTGARPDEKVRHEAIRSVLNVVGTAIGAARADETDRLVHGVRDGESAGNVPVPGRGDNRLAPQGAALVTGFAAHLHDFDDTHLATVVHPAASVLGAALPLAWRHEDVSGEDLVRAVAAGIELQLRVAVAMSPSHYDEGWHITGTVGPLGAATTAAVLLGLDPARAAHALSLASSLALGHRESFGTMLKAFHPGKAAANGLLAATLARRGATGLMTVLDGPRGYFRVMAPEVDTDLLTEEWDTRWELLSNTYKPYPCGIVTHPANEAAEALHPEMGGRELAGVEVLCHPLVAELTGNPSPGHGLQARFSTIHGVAAGLVRGLVDLDAYADDFVTSDAVSRIRGVTRLVSDNSVARDEATVTVTFNDGTTATHRVDHARGSLARPLTNDELDDKVARLVGRSLPGQERTVIDATRRLVDATTCGPWIETLAGAQR